MLAKVLHQAGRAPQRVVPARRPEVYVTDLGPVVQQGTPLATGSLDVPPFDRDALIGAIRAD